MKKIFFVGNAADEFRLESSYKRAFEQIGFEVKIFDPVTRGERYIKLGPIGKVLHSFLPVEEWRRKVNRDFLSEVKEYKPDMLIIGCNAPILFSYLAFLKIAINTKIILLWPDPVPNIGSHILNSAPIYDGVATFSHKSINAFESLGFKNVKWIPLAADPYLHKNTNVPLKYAHDICFIGDFRKERGELLEDIKKKFQNLNIGIYGPNWYKYNGILKNSIFRKNLRGEMFADKLNKSKICLNIFDENGLEAPNMRFFEIPISSSLQLSSICTEMNEDYVDMENITYFNSTQTALDKIEFLLSHQQICSNIRKEGYNVTLKNHTYYHRAIQIIDYFL